MFLVVVGAPRLPVRPLPFFARHARMVCDDVLEIIFVEIGIDLDARGDHGAMVLTSPAAA